MKYLRYYIAISFLFSCFQVKSNIIFDSLAFANGQTIPKALSYDRVINSIENENQSDTTRIFQVSGYIYSNIQYDLESFLEKGHPQSGQQAFQTKKATCTGFANLFQSMCNDLNIECHLVEGYLNYDQTKREYYENNHIWNVVKLGNQYYHCDLSSAIGFAEYDSAQNLSFVSQFRSQFLLVNDNRFLAYRMPAHPMWQLRNHPYQMEAFNACEIIESKDTSTTFYNFTDTIANFMKMNKNLQERYIANQAYLFNSNNKNLLVVSYYNQSVTILRNEKASQQQIKQAKQMLIVARRHCPNAYGDVRSLQKHIDKALQYTNQRISKQ
jgi:hypothetical protein